MEKQPEIGADNAAYLANIATRIAEAGPSRSQIEAAEIHDVTARLAADGSAAVRATTETAAINPKRN